MRPLPVLALVVALASAPAAAQLIPLSGDFQINSDTPLHQFGPSGAVAADGSFMVVWASETSNGSDVSSFSIQGRLFASSGEPRGNDFQINTTIEGPQTSPSVASQPGGTYVVVWADESYSAPAIRGQRFGADGFHLGGEFQVGEPTYGYATLPDVAVAGAAGEFVVAWESGDASDYGYIQARRFTADGRAVGAELAVTDVLNRGPDVAASVAGNFVVVWSEWASRDRVLARCYGADGAPLLGSISPASGGASLPGVAMRPGGNFLVAWRRNDGSVEGRGYAADCTPLGPLATIHPGEGSFPFGEGPVLTDTAAGYVVAFWRGGSEMMSSNIVGQLVGETGTVLGDSFPINSQLMGAHIDPAVAANPSGRVLAAWRSDTTSDSGSFDIQGRLFRLPDTCIPGSTRLCLQGGRFEVEVEWKSPEGAARAGDARPLTEDSGTFWFFSPSNLELMIKVLDACSSFDRFWVFAGGLTNVEVEITVTDTATGAFVRYTNPQGTPFEPIQDTDAFMTCP